MPILSFDSELKRAGAGTPFSNGFEGESWMANWCDNCRLSEDGDGCVLTDVARLNKTPYMWEPYRSGSLGWQFLCHSYLPLPESSGHAPALDTPPPM